MMMNEKDLTDDYIEGLLRDHFKAEVAEQPASKHPWDWLKSRLESPSRPPGFRGFLSAISKPLVAGVAVLVVMVGAAMWLTAAPTPQFGGYVQGFVGEMSGLISSNQSEERKQLEEDIYRDMVADARRAARNSESLQTADAILDYAAIREAAAAEANRILKQETGTAQSQSFAWHASPRATAVPGLPGLPGNPGPPGAPGPPQAPPPSATTFKDYERSWLASTAEDNVSTFSLDTDRTSFQLALNWARSGLTVDPDSVRAEEWINAFDYFYDPSVYRDSFAITTDVFRHPLNSGMQMVRLGFQAPELQDDTPLNVTLVLDASGSMSDGNRVAIAREAAESIRRSLRSRDRIGVVQFTTGVIHELTVEHTAPDDRAVRRSIDRLVPHASTNVQAGLDLGVKLADRARRERPDAYNYIILMSDGVANVNATDPFAILESEYDEDASNPLRLITVGVGIENYNDYLLEQLAQHGNGWYRYLSDVDQARATFSRENWLALSIPFADQTRAQVTWNDEVVEYWRMIGYENRVTSDESFVEDRKEFAEIPMGAATTVFFEVQLHDDVLRRASNTVELGDVQLRWVTPKSGLTNRQSAAMTSQLDRELGTSGDALLEFAAIVALASDRYGSLSYVDVNGSADVRRDLQTLSDRLQSLSHQLGHLDSYRDFAFLLDHMMAALPSDTRSNTGYSR